MYAGQNESKMLRNSRQREVETALWCLSILIWVRVFIYVPQGNILFLVQIPSVSAFFSPALSCKTCKDTVLGGGEKLIKFC